MGPGMKVSISVSLLLIDLVRKGAIMKMRDKKIQKGDRVVFLGFHSELDVSVKAIQMVEEKDEAGMAMRPYDKHVIYKLKPTFRFEMKIIYSLNVDFGL